MSRLIMYLIIIHMLLVLFDFRLGWLSEYLFASSYIPLDES